MPDSLYLFFGGGWCRSVAGDGLCGGWDAWECCGGKAERAVVVVVVVICLGDGVTCTWGMWQVLV
jgi:hypothetical protein